MYFKFKMLLKKFDAYLQNGLVPAMRLALGEDGAAKVEFSVKEQLRNATLTRWAYWNHHMSKKLDELIKKHQQKAKTAAETKGENSDESLAKESVADSFARA